MTPWVYRTADYGKTWTRIVGPDKGVRGYAHTIKEDTVKKDLLFLGTELGLWISLDGGAKWAQFKGGDFPNVAVREVQVQPRDNDLVIATHGRGIWIVDDLTPLRALSDDDAAEVDGVLADPPGPAADAGARRLGRGRRDVQRRERRRTALSITYYLRSRHVYGPIKLEVLDAAGKLVDTVTPSKRRGINRVAWNMRVKPPRVPRAAQVAFGASQGPRVPPGTLHAAADPRRRGRRDQARDRARSPRAVQRRPTARRSSTR